MDESERLLRIKQDGDKKADRLLAERIGKLLNHPKIDHYCLVDAYYYDFSMIPEAIQKIKQFYGDVYLLFGITTDGEIITKWVKKDDLNSSYEIFNGEVDRPEEKGGKVNSKTISFQIIKYYKERFLSNPNMFF